MAANGDGENFLSRWSRLKRATRELAPEAPASSAAPVESASASAAAPELPPVESLDFSSDFSLFMQPDVEAWLKQAAMKKLFSAEHFQQMDGLDTYIADYHSFEPIGEATVQALLQAPGLASQAIEAVAKVDEVREPLVQMGAGSDQSASPAVPEIPDSASASVLETPSEPLADCAQAPPAVSESEIES